MTTISPTKAEVQLAQAISKLACECQQQGLSLTHIVIEGTRPDILVNGSPGAVQVQFKPRRASNFFQRAADIQRRELQLKLDIHALQTEFGPTKPKDGDK